MVDAFAPAAPTAASPGAASLRAEALQEWRPLIERVISTGSGLAMARQPVVDIQRGVVVGYGNNGKDGAEGARRLNAYGTYLHGSLLPKNPWLTDQLILNALRRVDDGFELEPLDDTTERDAFSSVARRVSGRR
jgi:hypothetical protein